MIGVPLLRKYIKLVAEAKSANIIKYLLAEVATLSANISMRPKRQKNIFLAIYKAESIVRVTMLNITPGLISLVMSRS